MFGSRSLAGGALLLLPTGLMAFFAFNSGGFFPGTSAYAAIVLCVVLAIRVTTAMNPFEGCGWMFGFVAGVFALYVLWTLLSEAWSHAPGSALIEFDRALVYLLAMVLFGSIAHSRLRLAWTLRALAVGIVVVCGCGLITRVLPHLWPTSPSIDGRLSFPVTYTNVLGLLAAFGILLCLHLASDERESRVSRVLGAAAVPLLATTLYFTFSRGSIIVCVAAVCAYAILGRPRALLSATLAIAPMTAIALIVAYDAKLLATKNLVTPAAVVQAHHVAVAVAACTLGAALLRALLATFLDGPLERFTLPRRHRRRIVRTGWGTLGVGAGIAVVALSGTIAHDYHRFVHGGSPGSSSSDPRARLTDPGNGIRLEAWRIAWREFKSAPLLGHGAGTYKNAYMQHRNTPDVVADAHSLYMETLDELGIVGLLLLGAVIVVLLVRAAVRIRGPNRALYAALFVLLLAWALEAGIDWDWEMPVVTIVFFALGGFALARPLETSGAVDREPASWPTLAAISPGTRMMAGLGCILLAVAPAYVWLSQRKLDQASSAFSTGNCHTTMNAALSSISILGIRPEAYELVAYCDVRRDMPRLAVTAIDKATSLDRQNWQYVYDLAVMRATAGLDPRAAARRALTLNPIDSLVRHTWQTFSTDTPAQWRSDGKRIADSVTSL